RRIRFSVLTPDEYDMVGNAYSHKLLESLDGNAEFAQILESKFVGYIKPQAELKKDAEKLSKNSDTTIANLGKAILKFFASGFKTIDELLLAISAVLMVGGVTLSTCITLIIGILLFAVTVIPFAALCGALDAQAKALGKVIDSPGDANTKKYAALSKNIRSQKSGVKDIKELEKMVAVSEALDAFIEVPHEDAVIENQCAIVRATRSRRDAADLDETNAVTMMQIYENLAPADMTLKGTTFADAMLESADFGDDDGTQAFMAFEQILNNECLCGTSLLKGLSCIVTEVADQKSILRFLNLYKATAVYEFTHPAYSDFPLLEETGATIRFLEKRCEGNEQMLESINQTNQLLAEIIDEAYDAVKESEAAGGAPVCAPASTTETGFNPDPFDIGSLTPFPVAERRIQRTLCELAMAETDDEITEALINLGRITSIINESYTVQESDGAICIIEADIGKAARRASDKAHQGFSKAATKDKAVGVGAAVKNTVDPMEKFIQKQYQILKEKDANERRNVIMKGGALPKVLRWVKRSIGLAVGAAVGQVIPAAAVVTGIVFIGYVCTDKYLDAKERNKILRELEDEIQICNEKIDDSRGDDNKQKKYELMRIRNQLNRTADKIRFGLKYA
ncbi:MAG: hypothetical protein NC548_37745, partial [Lachnospiraceae bacterium]|nr:hypothetical protein [Lachnospiraceae bacterium]